MLEIMVCNEKWLAAIIVGKVEVEALVDKVVHFLASSDVQVLDGTLHDHIFIDLQERQHNIFVSIVGFLEIHLIVEIVLKDRASASLSCDQVLRGPLEFSY